MREPRFKVGDTVECVRITISGWNRDDLSIYRYDEYYRDFIGTIGRVHRVTPNVGRWAYTILSEGKGSPYFFEEELDYA